MATCLSPLLPMPQGLLVSNRSRRNRHILVMSPESRILLARGALDVFDDLLGRARRCLSHRPLLSGYDEQQNLS